MVVLSLASINQLEDFSNVLGRLNEANIVYTDVNAEHMHMYVCCTIC